MQAAVEARGASGVRCVVGTVSEGTEIAALLLAPPWSSSASSASTIGRFVGPDEADACRIKWAICKAASQHAGVLSELLGPDLSCEMADLAARGPLTEATYSYHAEPNKGVNGPSAGRRRPAAVPRVATMYATM